MKPVKWHLLDTALDIKHIINDTDWLKKAEIVKHNPGRTIYKLSLINGSTLYIKHNHPKELKHRIKALFFPKAKKEFRSAMLLRDMGIPIIPVMGWGHCGSDSFLITKEISKSITLKELLEHRLKSGKDIDRIMLAIAKFLRLLIEKGVDHPDLHAGNILVKEEKDDFSLYLVDLYGIRFCNKKDKKRILKLFGWTVTILWPLEWDKIKEFLYKSGFLNKNDNPRYEWERLARWRSKYILSRCKKRKKKLLKNSSLCRIYRSGSKSLIFRNDKIVKNLGETYILKIYPKELAKKCWFNTYFLTLYGIPIVYHYTWLKVREDLSAIIMERPCGVKLKDVFEKGTEEEKNKLSKAIRRLKYWADIADISISLDPNSVYVINNAWFPLLFSNPESFSLHNLVT